MLFCYTIPDDADWLTFGDSVESDSNGFANDEGGRELELKLPVLFRDDKFKLESGEPSALKLGIW